MDVPVSVCELGIALPVRQLSESKVDKGKQEQILVSVRLSFPFIDDDPLIYRGLVHQSCQARLHLTPIFWDPEDAWLSFRGRTGSGVLELCLLELLGSIKSPESFTRGRLLQLHEFCQRTPTKAYPA